jgi:bifunctional DNase/RNase
VEPSEVDADRVDSAGSEGAGAVSSTGEDGKPEITGDDVTYRVMDLVEVAVPLPATHGLVVLSEAESPYRSLTIPIALPEASALSMASQGLNGTRPMTHELFSEVLARVQVDVIALRVTGCQGGTYLAEIDLMSQRGPEVVACRPSDGMILCLRQTVPSPILVNEQLLESS